MIPRRYHHFYIYGLAGIFLATVIAGLSDARKIDRVKLFFKDRRSGRLVAERSSVPRVRSPNERISWIVRELSAGPVDSRFERTVIPNMRVQGVVVQGKTAYVSLDWGFVESLGQNPHLIVKSVVKSVRDNVRGLEDVRILIDGIEPVNTFFGLHLAGAKKD